MFSKKCSSSLLNCEIKETKGVIITELKKKILKTATIYKEEKKKKKK